MSNILCLDLGTQMGWALKNADGGMASGSVNLLPDRSMRPGVRFLNMMNWLNSLSKVHEVYFERVCGHKGTHAAHVYGGFMAVLMTWCEQRKAKYKGVLVPHIKRNITDNSKATKAEVIEAVKKLGYEPTDDNEADAIAILRWVENMKEAA